MSRVLCVAACGIALLWSNASDAVPGVLTVDSGSSSLEASLDAIATDSDAVDPGGNLHVDVTFANDPTHGLYVSNLEVVSGSLTLDDANLSVIFATDISLTAGNSAVSFQVEPLSVAGTATAANTSAFDLGSGELTFDGGSLSATGTLLGEAVNESHDFTVDALTATLPSGTTLDAVVQQTSPGQFALTLTLPVDLLVLALDDPMAVPVEVTGTVVFSGALAVPAPSLGAPGLALLAISMAGGALYISRRRD